MVSGGNQALRTRFSVPRRGWGGRLGRDGGVGGETSRVGGARDAREESRGSQGADDAQRAGELTSARIGTVGGQAVAVRLKRSHERDASGGT